MGAAALSCTVLGFAVLSCGADVESPPPPPDSAAAADRSVLPSVQGFLSRLFEAGRTGDRGGWTAGLSGRDPDFTAEARTLWGNLRQLDLDRLDVRLTGAEKPPSATGSARLGPDARTWQITLSWRLTGESAPAAHDVWVTVAPGPAGLQLAGLDDAPPAPSGSVHAAEPLWWRHGVTRIDRGDLILLLGAGQAPTRWTELVATSVADARTRLPAPLAHRWPGRIVVEVPGSVEDFATVLGADRSTYAGTAAVTRAEGPNTRAALRIVVNPALAQRPVLERRLTLTHETVHVATDSAQSPAPLWAVEGLAEFVAYRAQPGARRSTRHELGVALAAEGMPTAWPADRAFDAGAGQAAAAYAQAWIACDVIARDHSNAALGDFYGRLDDGDSVATAARRALHTDEATLLAAWRAELGRVRASTRVP